MNRLVERQRGIWIAAVVVFLAVLPSFGSEFFVNFVMTRSLILGLAAVTLIYLAAYGGMVSLAQWLIVGVSGFMIGNAVAEAGSKGLKLGLNDWVAILFAVGISVAVSVILGALSSRTTGIYFLMLTFVYAVIGFYFFGQVTTFSGFGGITGIDPPEFFIDRPERLYWLALVLSLIAYLALRASTRTPFGMALQGLRDDPVRMASLGFNVPVLRTIAFTIAGFVASLAGVLNVWWNGQIDPTSISTGPTLDLLIVAVIGGIAHLEGAWIGALVYVVANNYLRDLPFLSAIGITEARFNTVVGIVMLVILVVSPDGISGIAGKGRDVLRSRGTRSGPPAEHAEVGSE